MLRTERRPRETGVPKGARDVRVRAAPVAASSEIARPAVAPETRPDALAGLLARAVQQCAERVARPVAIGAAGVPALRRSIADPVPTRMLQRVPTARVTAHPMSTTRIAGANPQVIAASFATLRERHTADSHAILNDLRDDHLWGRSKSDVTGDDEVNYAVRIDRQNPTRTGQNVQIQTNGTSITIATVLVHDSVANKAGLITAVRQAFRASLADGMQWEVYDEPVVETAPVYVKGGKGGGSGGKGGGSPKKGGGGPGKKGGGGGGTGGRRIVKT